MKIIIAGGRDFTDKSFLEIVCDELLEGLSDIEIVSGMQVGADTLGWEYAKSRGYKIAEFPADWKQYKRSAGPIRNRQMAEYADGLIAFFDGSSRGTKNMIECAVRLNLKRKIFPYGAALKTKDSFEKFMDHVKSTEVDNKVYVNDLPEMKSSDDKNKIAYKKAEFEFHHPTIWF